MKPKVNDKINLKSYAGDAFIGIDVHRQSYSIAVVIERVVVKKSKLPAEAAKLIAYLKKLLPKAKSFSVATPLEQPYFF